MSVSNLAADSDGSGVPNEPAASIRAERSSTGLVRHERRDELIDRQRFELHRIAERVEDSGRLLRLEVRGHRLLELLHEHGHAFAAALAMTDREIHVHPPRRRAVAEKHLNRIAD